jgi:hypothetical protein
MAKASAYPPIIHWRAELVAWRSARIVGAATLTILPSSRSMHWAARTKARIAHL